MERIRIEELRTHPTYRHVGNERSTYMCVVVIVLENKISRERIKAVAYEKNLYICDENEDTYLIEKVFLMREGKL